MQVYARQEAARVDDPAARDAALRRLFGTWLWLFGQIARDAPSGAIPHALRSPDTYEAEPGVAGSVLAAPGDWLEVEQSALVVAVERAAALGLVDVAVALATALCGSVFSLGNHFEAWRRSHAAALAAARSVGNWSAEATLLTQLGQLSYTQDAYAAAYPVLGEAVAIFRSLGDARGEATAVASLGWVYLEEGRPHEALHHLTQARGCFTAISLDPAIGHSSRLIGTIRLEQGDFEGARVDLLDAIAAYRRLGSLQGEALSVRSLSLVYRAAGDLHRALALSSRALELFRAANDDKFAAYGQQAVAKTLIRLGRHDAALALLASAFETCERFGDKWGMAFMLRTRGELRLAQGDLDAAFADLCEAVHQWRALGVALMPPGRSGISR